MDTAWIGVIGSLGGVTLGLIGSVTNQKLSYRRESGERLAAARRATYLAWLAKVQQLYDSIANIHRQSTRGTLESAAGARQLRELSSLEAQTALEELRLVSGDEVAAAAATVWSHLRREKVPIGQDMDPAHWRQWREGYWELRRSFLDAARVETGLSPLDWAAASVTVGKPKRF
jgi:hypothetical protein